MAQKWIGPQEGFAVGDRGFLIEHSNGNTGAENFYLRDTPPYTNQSNEPRLFGWCGSYNNVSTNGHGAWEVIRVAKNDRLLISELEGDKLREFLEEFGYPELIPEPEKEA